jgi:hypothetical protein
MQHKDLIQKLEQQPVPCEIVLCILFQSYRIALLLPVVKRLEILSCLKLFANNKIVNTMDYSSEHQQKLHAVLHT